MFCFDEFLGVLKSGAYICVYNAVFFADFFPRCPACKASNNSMHRHPSPSHRRLPMADRGIDHNSFIHPVTSMRVRGVATLTLAETHTQRWEALLGSACTSISPQELSASDSAAIIRFRRHLSKARRRRRSGRRSGFFQFPHAWALIAERTGRALSTDSSRDSLLRPWRRHCRYTDAQCQAGAVDQPDGEVAAQLVGPRG